MSKSDYRRPADYQIENHFRCTSCRAETSVSSVYGAPTMCHCGGNYEYVGESYPANADDWDEYRDNVNDEFRRDRRW